MSEQPAELSASMQRLAAAIRGAGQPLRAVVCGFDLWVEVLSSPHITLKNHLKGGVPAQGDEDPAKVMIVPLIVLGGSIIVCLDPTLAPDEFVLKT